MQKVSDAIILTWTNRILLVKRKIDHDEWWLWSLPWGIVKENGESIFDGLKRELKEELWIDIDNFSLFESFKTVWFIAHYFVVHIENPKIILNRLELDAVDFFSYEEILKIWKLAFNQESVIKNYFLKIWKN